jgi:hypothetical protein
MKLTNRDIKRYNYTFNYSNISWNYMDIIILSSNYHNSIIGQLSNDIFRRVHGNVVVDVYSYMRTQ